MRWWAVVLSVAGCAGGGGHGAGAQDAQECEARAARLQSELNEAKARPAENATEPDGDAPIRTVAIADSPRDDSEIHYRFPRAAFDGLLSNQAELMRGARLVPVKTEGRPTGLRLFGMRGNSPLIWLGFKNGDELRHVNGLELATPQQALEAYTQIRNATEVRVEIIRGGQPLTLRYELVEDSRR